jgi:hypothetical protein
VGARLPAPTAKDFDDAALGAQAVYLKFKAREAINLEYSSASAMAWAQKYWTAKWDDTELALHASKREHKAQEAAKSKPGSPSSGALVMARTVKWVAGENGDAELMAHGMELERRALEAIKLPELPEVQKSAT